MRPLSNSCREMLMQAEITGECVRYVNAPRDKKWKIGGLFFHEFTGDALTRRGLLVHYVDQHDGSSFDRYEPARR